MRDNTTLRNRVVFAVAVTVIGFGAIATAGEESAAQAGEKVGVEGTFVRVAENDEGWVVLGYRAANEAAGKEWMFLDIGITLQKGVKHQKLTRDDIALVTPDHKVIPMLSQEEFEKARSSFAAMERADTMMHDSIDYWPPETTRPCRIGFFADPAQPMRGLAVDEVDLDHGAACLGRVYFQVPGGIQYGNHNLDVKLEGSVIRVPMDIMTKEQAKEFEKKWKEELKEAKHKH
jgi:hypothetical protein